jgi:RHS repeat-associated protein
MANPFQFGGRFGVMHEANGLEFMRARFYSPAAGRFTAQDPIRLAGGDLNLYRYVANSPTNFLDPIGLLSGEPSVWDAIGGVFAVTAASEYGALPAAAAIGELGAGGAAAATIGAGIAGAGLAGYGAGSLLDAALDALSEATGLPLTPDRAICELTNCDGADNSPGGPGVPGDYPPGSGDQHYAGAGGFGPFGAGALGGLFPGAVPMPNPDPNGGGGGGSTGSAGSFDPNAKTAPGGFGTANFVRADGLLPYRVDFENDRTATAPAQRVDVTDPLDARLDWDTLEFTTAGFGDTLISVPPGHRHFRTTVPMRYNNRDFQVEIELDFDSATGRIRASFRSFDPNTFMPLDVLTGFLPPEDGSRRGMGHFSYVIRPDAGLPSGTAIRNVADIRFDYAAIITTNRVDPHDPAKGTDPAKEALITLDAGLPTSSVQALPAVTDTASFLVRWSGTDDAGGSGVAGYDVYVAENGGPFTRWLTGTQATSAVFDAQNGRTYAFYSIATDNVGQRQPTPPAAQATTRTDIRPPRVQSVTVNDGAAQRSMVTRLSVTFNTVVTLDPGAFTLQLVGGAAVGLSQAASVVDGRTVAVLTFTGAGVTAGSLNDGRYVLTVNSARARDRLGNALDGDGNGTAGGDTVTALHRLYGDATGDARVDNADFFLLRQTFGRGAADPLYLAYLDANGDGLVDNVDFFQFRIRFGTGL